MSVESPLWTLVVKCKKSILEQSIGLRGAEGMNSGHIYTPVNCML